MDIKRVVATKASELFDKDVRLLKRDKRHVSLRTADMRHTEYIAVNCKEEKTLLFAGEGKGVLVRTVFVDVHNNLYRIMRVEDCREIEIDDGREEKTVARVTPAVYEEYCLDQSPQSLVAKFHSSISLSNSIKVNVHIDNMENSAIHDIGSIGNSILSQIDINADWPKLKQDLLCCYEYEEPKAIIEGFDTVIRTHDASPIQNQQKKFNKWIEALSPIVGGIAYGFMRALLEKYAPGQS